jgi:hypothetical protein
MSRNQLEASMVYWLPCWPLVPKIAGSIPAEAVGFFGWKSPQHAFFRKGSKALCPMSQICGMLKNPLINCGSRKLYAKLSDISCPLPFLANRCLWCRLT